MYRLAIVTVVRKDKAFLIVSRLCEKSGAAATVHRPMTFTQVVFCRGNLKTTLVNVWRKPVFISNIWQNSKWAGPVLGCESVLNHGVDFWLGSRALHYYSVHWLFPNSRQRRQDKWKFQLGKPKEIQQDQFLICEYKILNYQHRVKAVHLLFNLQLIAFVLHYNIQTRWCRVYVLICYILGTRQQCFPGQNRHFYLPFQLTQECKVTWATEFSAWK